MRERPQTRSASLWLLQWRGGARGVRHRTPPYAALPHMCGTLRRCECDVRRGASAARGALRNTIANIKREKHQGQRHEAPQRMAAHIKKNLDNMFRNSKEKS